MEFTGERYIPSLRSAKISYEHWHRYIYAKGFAQNKIVLDAACGEGYGTAYLSSFATHVTGIDLSEEAINHAQKKYLMSNLSFIKTPANDLPFKEETFDTIVSFETIEHLSKEEHDQFLKEARRTLKPEGFLVISTPNKKVYSDKNNYRNPFHISEFYEEEFMAFLKKEFSHVHIFQQQVFCGSLIANSLNESITQNTIKLTENGYSPVPLNLPFAESEYLIGICANTEFPLPDNGLLVDVDNQLYLASNSFISENNA